MEEIKYFSLLECLNIEGVFKYLDNFTIEGKLDYKYDDVNCVVKLIDIELTDNDLKNMASFFDKNDIMEDIDYNDLENINYGDISTDFLNGTEDDYDF